MSPHLQRGTMKPKPVSPIPIDPQILHEVSDDVSVVSVSTKKKTVNARLQHRVAHHPAPGHGSGKSSSSIGNGTSAIVPSQEENDENEPVDRSKSKEKEIRRWWWALRGVALRRFQNSFDWQRRIIVRRVPCAARFISTFHRLPRFVKVCVLLSWIVWKFVMTFIFLRVVYRSASRAGDGKRSRGSKISRVQFPEPYRILDESSPNHPFRILHVITSLSEFDYDDFRVNKQRDRLASVLLPAMQHSLTSLLSRANWQVDVYLILGYELRPERKQLILDSMPSEFQGTVEIWDDAIPLVNIVGGTQQEGGNGKKQGDIQEVVEGFAWQHRLVLKDKLDQSYDFFMALEDDAYVSAEHVENFWEMSAVIESERLEHISSWTPGKKNFEHELPENRNSIGATHFYEPMTADQLGRLIPAVLSVEVMRDDYKPHSGEGYDSIIADFDFSDIGPVNSGRNYPVDPAPCCHVSDCEDEGIENGLTNEMVHCHFVLNPTSDRLVVRGATPEAIVQFGAKSISKMRSGWVALLTLGCGSTDLGVGGGGDGKQVLPMASGAGRKMKKDLDPLSPQMFGQWHLGLMASREQIRRMYRLCNGRFFLPPYKNDTAGLLAGQNHFSNDDTDVNACQFQAVLSIDPARFSRQLLYRTSNEGQKRTTSALAGVNDVLGILNSLRKRVAAEVEAETTDTESAVS